MSLSHHQKRSGLPSRRQLRVAEIVRQTLALPLQRFPLLIEQRQAEMMINVTSIDMSPDLKQARVYVRCFAQQNPPENWLKQLRAARRSLRAHLGRQLDLKFTPDLHFVEDQSFNHADTIERIIAEDYQRNATCTPE